MSKRTIVVSVGAAAIAATIAVSGQAAMSTQRLSLQADPHGKLRYNKKTLTAKAGRVTIVMRNPSTSGIRHGIAVEGKGVDKDGRIVAPGKTSTLTLSLKPGRYTFYCNFDGHRGRGMKGTLIVR
jgi:uncharacterized cupredoxin-like copper-binding protein